MRRGFILLLVLIGVMGCQPVIESATPTPLPTPAPLPLLPAPLYFVDAASGQLMRMERDGAMIQQITNEPARIDEFAISPVDGTLAYISNDTLLQSDAFGDNRIVKVKGEFDTQKTGVDRYKMKVGSPIFSPDGRYIAFALNGVNVMEAGKTTVYRTILPNAGNPRETTIAFFEPTPGWSPDGKKLWVSASGYGSINAGGLLDLQSGEFRFPIGNMPYPPSDGAVWSSSGSFFVTPWILTKIDAATMQSHLLNESWRTSPVAPLAEDLVRMNDGRWLALAMMSEGDEFGIAEIRLDSGELRWLKMLDGPPFGILAPDGSGALLKHHRESDGYIDQLVWWSINGAEAVRLATGNLVIEKWPRIQWGVR
jgi:dipeptidyl aminopeptidase/acylaminoacyl peptidase